VLPRPKQGDPYLPTGIPRNPRHDKAKPRRSSSPYSTVGIIGFPFWSALLSKLDNNAVVEVSAPFHGHWTGMHLPGPHEALSIERIQSVLGILSYKWSTLIQGVAGGNTATYATVFKLNKPKAWGHEMYQRHTRHCGVLHLPVMTRTSTIRPEPSKNLATSSERASIGKPGGWP
jgi:hypothetical protein